MCGPQVYGKTGARGPGRGPGMPGPYRYREQLSGLMTSIDPYTVGADSISARGSMRQRKPRGGVKTPPYDSPFTGAM